MPRKVVGNQPLNLLMNLLEIPGISGQEKPVLDYLLKQAIQAGLPEDAYYFDQAHTKAKHGECGNLIIKLPGLLKKPRRLLMAHTDTVPLCLAAEPHIGGDYVFSKNRKSALGGDDRAGTAVVLHTLIKILREKTPHPPLTFLFAVQEEIGLVGARYVAKSKLGNPQLCFNFDGNLPNGVIIGATGDDHIDITIHGIASHAGAQPENGVSAIVIAGAAIADLQQRGWLGKISQSNGEGTSNLGFIQGGAATNVVTDHLIIKGEARSHNKNFRGQIVAEIEQAFLIAAANIKNAEGKTGSMEFHSRNKYEAFRLEEDSPVVNAAKAAIIEVGLEPITRVSNGGLDANWMTNHGLPTVTLGCGQEFIHTTAERLHIPSFHHACQIAWKLATSA